MRYAVCFEIEAESASEAVGAIKKDGSTIVSVSEASCPSLSQFDLANMWRIGNRMDSAEIAAKYVFSHWKYRCEENPLHSKLRLCNCCGYVKKESDVHLIESMYEKDYIVFSDAIEQKNFVCSSCLPSVLRYKTEMRGVHRAKFLIGCIGLSWKKTPSRNIDWDGIEKEYATGKKSLRKIGAEFGVSDAGILKRAKKHGWSRDFNIARNKQKQCVEKRSDKNASSSDDLCDFLDGVVKDLKHGAIDKERAKQIANFADFSVEILRNEIRLNALTRR